MARSNMNKEVSIRYTGDIKDMKRAAAEAKRIISDQAAQIKAKNAEMNNSFTKVTSAAKTAAAAMVAVFSVRAIVNFTKESMKLAAEAEGVKNAFAKIGSSDILSGLQKATRGVIEASDLMALAVKAKSFNVPLKDLVKYLEFSTNKAINAGKSIQEFADIMVLALGGQSSRALKQLGLNTKDVAGSLKEFGSLMPLITDKLNEMGPVADTMAVRFGKTAAAVQNLKESWGEYVNQNEFFQKVLEGTAETFNRLADPELNFWQKLMWSGKKYEEWQTSAKIGKTTPGMSVGAFEDFIKLGIGGGKGTPVVTPIIGPYDELIKKIKEGAEESRKMAEAWKIIHKEMAGTGVPKGGMAGNIPILGIGFPAAPGLAGTPKMPIQEMTDGLEAQMDMVNRLQGTFENMFLSVDKGFKGMADAMIESIKRIAAELMAKAAVWAILRLIFPGFAAEAGIGSFGKFVSGGLIGGAKVGSNIGMSAQNIKIGGEFRLKGSDAYAMVQRYGSVLGGAT